MRRRSRSWARRRLTISMSRPMEVMRCRIRRRSDSSFVSPGPRVPIPPPSRDSALLDPTRRGSRYFSCASSTCHLPFPGPGARREDVEDQLRAIDDLAAQPLLELAKLAGCQFVVDRSRGRPRPPSMPRRPWRSSRCPGRSRRQGEPAPAEPAAARPRPRPGPGRPAHPASAPPRAGGPRIRWPGRRAPPVLDEGDDGPETSRAGDRF